MICQRYMCTIQQPEAPQPYIVSSTARSFQNITLKNWWQKA